MTRKLPIFAIVLVGAAVAVMIALGFWQLDRASTKNRLIDQYRNAEKAPPIAFPTGPVSEPLPLFRWATGNCVRPQSQRVTAGENRNGEPGYVHIVHCSTGADGPGMAVQLGWSKDPRAQFQWPGGPVTGIIAPDRQNGMRLVAASAPPGLEPSRPPSVESIPNNHRLYAIQWFAFAAIAVVIFVLALRRRARGE